MERQEVSPEELEHEIAQTRAEINRKLIVLRRRLSPRHVAGEMAGAAAEQGGVFLRNLGAALRDNPVPSVLLGVGLCWLMLAGTGRAKSRDHVAPRRPPSLAPATAAALALTEARENVDDGLPAATEGDPAWAANR